MGAQMVREVASRPATLLAMAPPPRTVLAQAIFREGVKTVAAGASPTALKRGIERAVEVAVEEIKRLSRDVKGDMIAQVGTISANNDKQIGGIIAEAMKKVGKDASSPWKSPAPWKPRWKSSKACSSTAATCLLTLLRTQSGWNAFWRRAHPHSRKEISSMKDLLPLLEQIAKTGKPLLIIAEDVEGEALATLWSTSSAARCSALRSRPLASEIAAKRCSKTSPPSPAARPSQKTSASSSENVKMEDLGRAKKVVIDKDNTTIVEGGASPPKIEGRVKQIRSRSRTLPPTTTRKSSRSALPSWLAALRSSRWAQQPKPS